MITKIINIVSNYYLISPTMVTSKNRTRKYVKARQMICLLTASIKAHFVAPVLNISRCNVSRSIKMGLIEMRFDKQFENDYSKLKKLVYETKR
jgi:hypothetical protein